MKGDKEALKQSVFKIKEQRKLTSNVYEMYLVGDTGEITRPGQFVNIQLDGFFLRRPISVCDVVGGTLKIIYKVVGKGTEYMAKLENGTELDVLTGLGNGYDIEKSGNSPVLLGGGVGVPPLYMLAKQLIAKGANVRVILGFNTESEIFAKEDFEKLGCEVTITTVDGSSGVAGFVTDALLQMTDYTYTYCCGPEPMLKAVYDTSKTSGEYSFEERMGCGFGACMGCSCKTKYGNKRICKEGPVLVKEEIIW